jgi:G3E family GTPase
VRGDLIRILGNLMKRRDRFDYILVETTGMADPDPVAQTFFVDDEIRARTKLDGLVTLVDAKHVQQHWDTNEVQEQIAFADVIMLNKTDLVSPEELDALEARIKAMNAAAEVVRSLVMNDPPPLIDQLGEVQQARQEQRQSAASGDAAAAVAVGPEQVQEPPDSKRMKTFRAAIGSHTARCAWRVSCDPAASATPGSRRRIHRLISVCGLRPASEPSISSISNAA